MDLRNSKSPQLPGRNNPSANSKFADSVKMGENQIFLTLVKTKFPFYLVVITKSGVKYEEDLLHEFKMQIIHNSNI